MPVINFSTKLIKIDSWTILRLPKEVSVKLPSRGMAMIEGTMNGFHFETVLEPDGMGSHWFKVGKVLSKEAKVDVGGTARLEIESSNKWPEPKVPEDLKKAFETVPQARKLWTDITPMARWDWIRWMRATSSAETRSHRIDVMFSKLKSGIRRPCCFNRTMCTEPSVSKNGVLLNQ